MSTVQDSVSQAPAVTAPAKKSITVGSTATLIVLALLLITAIGFALTSATVTWLSWQGYGFTLLGLPLDGELARTDMGVLVALVLGLLTPIALGIPAIRKQEATRLDA